MEKINILINNTNTEVLVVRNFKIDTNKYFIYTLDQIDEQNYQILYVVKVVNSDNILLGSGMLEESEWIRFVDIIKDIIKKNRENAPLSIEDLNIKELQNLTINEGRPFKLKKEMVELLSLNIQNVEAYDDLIPAHEVIEPVQENASLEPQELKLDYQKLYEEEKIFNEELKTENELLKQKLNKIKEITNELV